MKKLGYVLTLVAAFSLVGTEVSYSQKGKTQTRGASQAQMRITEEEYQRMLKESFDDDPVVAWRIQQDEAQKICSKYNSREEMPPKDIQKVMELSSNIKYPDWGIYLGNWENGKKIVTGSAGRNVPYGFSDKPGAVGANCYACHEIERGIVGGNLGPSLRAYGKRWGITKENLNSPETIEKIKIVYGIIYNSWAMYPCAPMPRYGHNAILSSREIADVVAYLLHPDSPVNK